MQNLGIRKLAGRLICELTFNCEHNQNAFTELFAFSTVNGKVSLNQRMPEEILQKLASDPSYLEVLKSYQDKEFCPHHRRYWCFPEYKSENRNDTSNQDLQRSVTPKRGTESVIDNETIEDYIRSFPDPQKYMVGFVCG